MPDHFSPSTPIAMKTRQTFSIVIGFIPILILSAATMIFSQNYPRVKPSVTAEDYENTDKTLSPFFFVKSDNPALDQLPLKATSAQVNIAGVIADVAVTQEYANEGKRPIEAVYIFPASTRAAVYSMKMTIGERTIVAKIAEKEQARKDYEEAKQQGKSASLLEQQRPNVFQMNVANIMPGDLIKVEMKYTELLIPEDGVYEFVYPTVVGPRYSNKSEALASLDEKWVSNPYTREGVKPLYTFDIGSSISAGMPISEVLCPSHKTNISFDGPSIAEIKLDPSEKSGGNRDFILKYRLSGNKVETGLLLYPGTDENFFLAMIQPPKAVKPAEIPPREYVFIVDVSGSMHGYPLDISKKLMRDLIGKLRTSDRFNVILFAGCSNLFSEHSVTANAENLNNALNFIDKEQGGGGTELLPALRRALELKGTEGYARSFVIATDGYVEVEREAFDLIRKNLDKANFFSFGIGTSVNRYLIEGMAHAGSGMPFVITKPEGASVEADRFRQYVSNPVLSHIKTSFSGLDVYDVEPLSVPDVFAERPVIIFGKYRGNPQGAIEIRGTGGNGDFYSRMNVADAKPLVSNAALRYLWARERIRNLDDMGAFGNPDEQKELVTQLGLKYNLLTRFTSFVAIDNQVRNTDGNLTTIQQPLPLPEGVSDYAVGGVMACSAPLKGKSSVAHDSGYQAVAYDEMAMTENTENEEENEIFVVAETMPEFPGGEKAMKKFIVENLVYPPPVKERGIKGKVYLTFIVKTDGTIADIKVLRGIGGGCNEEAVRVVKMMPRWKPGMQRAQPVPVQYNLVIEFK
jgi:Ca-activated chloride channel family protein